MKMQMYTFVCDNSAISLGYTPVEVMRDSYSTWVENAFRTFRIRL